MKAIGWTLIVAAVLMHISCCTWGDKDSSSQIVPYVHARDCFRSETGRGYYATTTYNIVLSGVLGLVVPALMAGGGIALIVYATKKQAGKAAGEAELMKLAADLASQVVSKGDDTMRKVGPSRGDREHEVKAEPKTSSSNLYPCPDCGRRVSRLATTCPQCGRPLTPEQPS